MKCLCLHELCMIYVVLQRFYKNNCHVTKVYVITRTFFFIFSNKMYWNCYVRIVKSKELPIVGRFLGTLGTLVHPQYGFRRTLLQFFIIYCQSIYLNVTLRVSVNITCRYLYVVVQCSHVVESYCITIHI